jgi:hypothetical protein
MITFTDKSNPAFEKNASLIKPTCPFSYNIHPINDTKMFLVSFKNGPTLLKNKKKEGVMHKHTHYRIDSPVFYMLINPKENVR